MSEEIQIQLVPVAKIKCASQVRKHFNQEGHDGLAQSIREIGVQLPIRVRCDPSGESGSYIVVDGERRLRAAVDAGRNVVPVIVEDRELSESDVVQRQLILNCQRESLTPMETAAALGELIRVSGWSASQAAAKLGFSNATVTRLLSLLSLPESIRDKVARGEIPPSAAYELSRIANPRKQAELAGRLVAGDLKRDGIKKAMRKRQRRSDGEGADSGAGAGTGGGGGSKGRESRVTAKVTQGLSVTVNASAMDLDSLIRWLDGLIAKARDARPSGVDLVTFLKSLKGNTHA